MRCSAADTHLNLTCVSGAFFQLGMRMSASVSCSCRSVAVLSTLSASHACMCWLQACHPCSIRSGVITRGAMVAHLFILMRLFAPEPRSTAIFLFPSQRLCGTIFQTLYSMVWDWRVSKAKPMRFYWPKLLAPFLPFSVFIFSFFFISWYCEAGVFGQIV